MPAVDVADAADVAGGDRGAASIDDTRILPSVGFATAPTRSRYNQGVDTVELERNA